MNALYERAAKLPAARQAGRKVRMTAVTTLIASYGVTLTVVAILVPQFYTPGNFQVVVTASAIIGVISVGQTLVVIAGAFDLSVGGVAPLAAIVFAKLANNGMSVSEAILVTVLIGLAVGVGNGYVVSVLSVNPLITTLATLSICGGAAYALSGGLTVTLTHPSDGVLGEFAIAQLPYFVLIFITIAVAAGLVLRFTVPGRWIHATGGSEEAARIAGIPTRATVIAVYAACAALAALAGLFATSELFAGTATIQNDSSLTSVTAVVLGGAELTGGTGSVTGTILAVLLLSSISNTLAIGQVGTFYTQIITGAILLMVVLASRLASRFGTRP